MKIGELAATTGVKAELIRYYERIGLLDRAPRSSGNYRAYSEIHVERLNFIKDCRELGLDIDEIRNHFSAIDDTTERGRSKDEVATFLHLVQAKAAALKRVKTHLRNEIGTRNRETS